MADISPFLLLRGVYILPGACALNNRLYMASLDDVIGPARVGLHTIQLSQ